jgi:maltose-binding protein MalE
MTDDTTQHALDDNAFAQEPRLWQNETWTAKVIKNDDDDGWAVAMFKDGESEAALIGPWTMGRDKKNPKPLDGNAFITLVKTASEFVRRSEQQLHATLHQSVTVNGQTGRITVLLDIVPDDDNPYATLSAQDEGGDTLAEVRVDAGYKLNRNTAQAWVDEGFARPKGARD